MKYYLLGFLGAYIVSLLMFIGMLAIAVANWLFSSSPLWFDVLCVILTALPVIVCGELSGRRLGKRTTQKPLYGQLILLPLMGLLGLLSGPLLEHGGYGQILIWPGTLLGGVLKEILALDGYWDGIFPLVGNLLLPLLFHLGWHWGTES